MPSESSDSVKIYYPQYSREELLALLKKASIRLSQKLPLVCVVLFGSYSKNRQTAASDVDLLVVYNDPKLDDDYSIVWDTLDVSNLEPRVYTNSEYIEQMSQETWLAREIQRSGIIVFGKLPTKS